MEKFDVYDYENGNVLVKRNLLLEDAEKMLERNKDLYIVRAGKKIPKKELTRCGVCGKVEHISDIEVVDGIKMCSVCYSANYYECFICGKIHKAGTGCRFKTYYRKNFKYK